MINPTPEFIRKIRSNKRLRQRLAFESPLWFCLIYLSHHFQDPFAPFHLEMFHLLEKSDMNLVAIMAFRGSGKSTIMNLANVLWSILGKPGKNFVLIFSQTQEQAKNHFANIKYELENNALLREDFGPFTENENMWNKLSLELEYQGSKIMSVTRDQSIRGIKYNEHRPDLIICDDMEDTSSIANPKESDILYNRFKSEIVSVGDDETRIIVLGNLISEKSFMMKLKDDISEEDDMSIFRSYPLFDSNGKNLWTSKFPNEKSIKKVADKSGAMWGREYLLNLETYGRRNESLDDEISLEDLKKFGDLVHEIQERYPDICKIHHQQPLVTQMKEFTITPPHIRKRNPRYGDPDYERFEQYSKEMGEPLKILIEASKSKTRKKPPSQS